MRPRRLDPESEVLLERMFSKVKSDMKGRSNQFQVASKLISYFRSEKRDYGERSHDVARLLDADKRETVRLVAVAKYFGLEPGVYGDLHWYLQSATPAAIVQMVKRKRFRYKTK